MDSDELMKYIEAELAKQAGLNDDLAKKAAYAARMKRDALLRAMGSNPYQSQYMPNPFSGGINNLPPPSTLNGNWGTVAPPRRPINNSQNSKNNTMNTKYQIYVGELSPDLVLMLEHPYQWSGRRKYVVKNYSSSRAEGYLYYGESDSSGVIDHSYRIERQSAGSWYADTNENGQAIILITDIIKPKVGMDTVILAQEKKDQILAAISQIDLQTKIFKNWGFEEVFEKGIAVSLLFFGTPGTGKTLMAQAIADQLGMTLTIVGTGDIETSEPGGAERNLMALFAKNKGKKNIILFDECDSLLSSREEVGTIMAAQINCLLSEIEKFDGVVIFTTNRLGKLDPALERRITAKIEFPFPDANQRLGIWKRMIPTKAPIAKDVDFEKLAKNYRIPGGNIKNAVLNSARKAAYDKLEEITMECFENAAKKEVESIKAFSDAFGKSVHTNNRGGGKGALSRDFGRLSVNKQKEVVEGLSQDIDKVKTRTIKKIKSLSKKNG